MILATALSLTMIGVASAEGARFRIEDPLPDELKGRIAALIRSERPRDADAALAAARIRDNGLWREGAPLLLRIETGCHGDLCMVMIGKVTNQAIIPQLTLGAGPTVSVSDELVELWGIRSTSFIFEGHGGTKIDVWGRRGDQGDSWIADACGSCFSASEPSLKPDLLPPPSDNSPD
ncbi:hypothetical protein [Methylobacterium sp. Leaf102]|uniref:hypothetical protein n=1 Tax=Methylobacterium sp. Leaf102 TaxID=1736253 RepID=UPI0012E78996|nr:hypothetical protein [Methylobacterium sp. Leaf102]